MAVIHTNFLVELVGDAVQIANFVINNGDVHDSRIGRTYEILNASISLSADEILYRPGMTRKLGIVEILQFFSGYFDERLIKEVVPKLQYDYGIANAYGIKVAQQLPKVIQQLKDNPESRRAILYIGKPEDGQEEEKPCMQLVQFQIRHGVLFTTVSARSHDAISGLPYDVILFSGVAQTMAKLLGIEAGDVQFNSASLHIYEHALNRLRDKFEEPWPSFYSVLNVDFPKEVVDLNSLRGWCIDELNRVDDWSGGLPFEWSSY